MTEETKAPESAGLERAEGLYQEIAASLLAEIEYFDKIPFGDLSPVEKSRIRLKVKNLAGRIVTEAIRIVNDESAPSVDAVLASVSTAKDGLKLALLAPDGQEHRHKLVDWRGREVLVVMPDYAKYYGGADEEDPPEVEKPAAEEKAPETEQKQTTSQKAAAKKPAKKKAAAKQKGKANEENV